MKFVTAFFLSVIFTSRIFACALCALYTPTAHVEIKLTTNNNNVTNIKMLWTFSQNFTNVTMQTYDINSNKQLEPSELKEITKAMTDYIIPKNYLSSFEYYDMPDGTSIPLNGNFKNAKSFIEDGRLVFEFDKEVDFELKNNRVLKIFIKDDEGFFNFKIIDTPPYDLKNGFFVHPNANLATVFMEFSGSRPLITKEKTLKSLTQQKQDLDELEKPKMGFFAKKTIDSIESLKSMFKAGNENFSILTLLSILGVSFVYGFFHAAGPGHAKLLTASYFLANGGSYLKAFIFALKIGVLHVSGALILVTVSMFMLENIAGVVSSNSAAFTTKIAAVLIITITSFIFYDKIQSLKKQTHHHSCKCSCCSHEHQHHSKKNEWFLAIAAALVPCPGTILIFVLAFSLGSFFLSIISAVFMSLGMSVVIFLAAIFGAKANELSSKNMIASRIYIEFFGLLVMFALGVFMFLISDRISVL